MRIDDQVHFCPPGRLIIQNGARHTLPALLQRLGYTMGVLVTDRFFFDKTPWVAELVHAAEAVGITLTVFADGQADPTTTLCDQATRELRNVLQGTAPDHIIALGGGSNIDLAKALSLTLLEGRPIADFTGDLGGLRPIPLVALPTTAGTGSEATPGAILVDPTNATKIAVMDNSLRPVIALIDPEYTYTCPPTVTADAGIDAFTHAIESFLTRNSHEFERNSNPDPGYSGRSSLTMMFAREAMRLCFAHLETAYQQGNDIQARTGMAYASLYAALSYGSAGLNAGHGIAYAVAGVTHRSHGSTNAVILPYVLDELVQDRPDEFLEIARMMDIDTADTEQARRQVPVAVRAMIGRLGIPTDLKAFGIELEQLDSLVEDSLGVVRLAKAFPVNNVAESYARIVRHAYHGRLTGAPAV
ncbi:iron-containing alcohol dehydrogenase [Pseudomonas putida]|uniref:iron-containing alcohol dehydrogenase n=1 Tax=Pseudomonas putida TaxID=303 RepID=UPI0023644ECB|nr:iron-containing alcohol dehydrogenase [Pseudomonas putida]MDD2002017.1 iron-containing alcohol dehydrogenase [Pseudomonas putida]